MDLRQEFQKLGKRTRRQFLFCVGPFVLMVGGELFLLVHLLRLIGEQYAVAVECDSNLRWGALHFRWRRIDQARGDPLISRQLYILRGQREEQFGFEGVQIGSEGIAPGKCGTGNFELVVVDGMEDAEAHIRVVS